MTAICPYVYEGQKKLCSWYNLYFKDDRVPIHKKYLCGARELLAGGHTIAWETRLSSKNYKRVSLISFSLNSLNWFKNRGQNSENWVRDRVVHGHWRGLWLLSFQKCVMPPETMVNDTWFKWAYSMLTQRFLYTERGCWLLPESRSRCATATSVEHNNRLITLWIVKCGNARPSLWRRGHSSYWTISRNDFFTNNEH